MNELLIFCCFCEKALAKDEKFFTNYSLKEAAFYVKVRIAIPQKTNDFGPM